MRLRWLSVFAIFLTLAGFLLHPQAVQAARGTPQSPDFGYGVRLDISGNGVADALQSAAILQVDWIVIDLDWSKQNPIQGNQPDLATLDQAMELAQRFEIPVVISLKNAPGWARNSAGPDPELTAQFVLLLAQRYPNSLKAIELLPGANTQASWGAAPDPKSYLAVYQAAYGAIKHAGLQILLVAAGLTPLASSQPASHDIDDLIFLKALYQAGARKVFSVISIQLLDQVGEPSEAPDGTQHRILRHYEEVRQVMLDNGDAQGILWITNLTWNSSKNPVNDVSLVDNLKAQSKWLTQAYQQLRSQLYIGVAFLTCLNNQGDGGENQNDVVLNGFSSNEHPFYSALKNLIAQNNPLPVTRLSFDTPQHKHIVKLRSNSP